ncbi:MAG: hypothetical protein ACYC1D_17220 [Acidimicrobiales bacterium]
MSRSETVVGLHRRADSGAVDPHARDLLDGVDAVLAGWVVGQVERVMLAWRGEIPPEVASAAVAAGEQARRHTVTTLAALLDQDVDDQRQTPLTLLRAAVRYPTAVLADAGVPPVERDAFAVRAFPQDLYDLSPASYADIDPALVGPGLAWGAAKAMAHRRRHAPPAS